MRCGHLAPVDAVVRQIQAVSTLGCDARLRYQRALDVCTDYEHGRVILHDARRQLAQLADEIAQNRSLWLSAWLTTRSWLLAVLGATMYIWWNHVDNVQRTSATMWSLLDQHKWLLASVVVKLDVPRLPSWWDVACLCFRLIQNEPPRWETPIDIAQRYWTMAPANALPDPERSLTWWSPVRQFVERVGWLDVTRVQEHVGLALDQHVLVVQRFQSETNSLFRSAQAAALTAFAGLLCSVSIVIGVMTYRWLTAPAVLTLRAPSPRKRSKPRSRRRKKRSKSK